MEMKFEGYGYEFNSEHYGGPFDGLVDSVVSFEENPPRFNVKRIDEGNPGEKKKLGQKLLDQWKSRHIADDTFVAVYKIEGRPEEYGEASKVPYHYMGTMTMSEYKGKYGSCEM
jgi:hypothetical protein